MTGNDEKRWRKFELLVAKVHEALDSGLFDIEEGKVIEDQGGRSQVDVFLKPKTPLIGPVLVSCKAEASKVGVGHVREWCAVVQAHGAAAGVIVSETGFTKDAIDWATPTDRRVSLYILRPFTDADFAPDAASPDGYIRTVSVRGSLVERRPDPASLKIDVRRADGRPGQTVVSYSFSAADRQQWYLTDESGAVVGNVWDMFVAQGEAMNGPGTLEVKGGTGTFLTLGGVRMVFNSLSIQVQHIAHPLDVTVDFSKQAFAYENAVTGEIRNVPLPTSMLVLPPRSGS